jgi:hypothetical protein
LGERLIFSQGENGIRVSYITSAITLRRLSEEEQQLLNLYRQILKIVPGLEAQVIYTLENRSSGLIELASYVRNQDLCAMISHLFISFKIDATSTKGRSDDCGSLRNNALNYIPQIKDIPKIEHKAKKEQRGFHHFATARLLCPCRLRESFDADMEGFCRSVQNGTLAITHNDWPSFLYPEDEYNADAIDEHLLHGPFLISVRLSQLFIHMLTLSLVLSAYIHRATHRLKGHAGKGAR